MSGKRALNQHCDDRSVNPFILCIIALCSVSIVTGCRIVQIREPSPQFATVDVAGNVLSPGQIPVPAEGLTLLQAIIRAGGVTEQDRSQQIVRLRKGDGTGENHYFPLTIVELDVAGEILLAPNDLVQVLKWDQTSLASSEIGPRNFRTSGLSSAVGDVETIVPMTLQEVAVQEVDPRQTPLELIPTYGVIHRTRHGQQNHFYVPLGWIDDGHGFSAAITPSLTLTDLGFEAAVDIDQHGLKLQPRTGLATEEFRLGSAANFNPRTFRVHSIIWGDVTAELFEIESDDPDIAVDADVAVARFLDVIAQAAQSDQPTVQLIRKTTNGMTLQRDLVIDVSSLQATPAVETPAVAALPAVEERIDPALLDAEILSQDNVELTRLERTPIIAASLLAPAIYQSLEERAQLSAALAELEGQRSLPVFGPICDRIKDSCQKKRTITIQTATPAGSDAPLRIDQVAKQLVP